MNHKRREKDHAQRYWPWCRRDGLSSLHSSLSVSGSWIRGRQSGLYRRALPFRYGGEQSLLRPANAEGLSRIEEPCNQLIGWHTL